MIDYWLALKLQQSAGPAPTKKENKPPSTTNTPRTSIGNEEKTKHTTAPTAKTQTPTFSRPQRKPSIGTGEIGARCA